MIELVRPTDSVESDVLAEELRDLVVAFSEVIDDELDSPVLRDRSNVATTPHQRGEYMDQLRRDLRLWQKYQSDTCYLANDDGTC